MRTLLLAVAALVAAGAAAAQSAERPDPLDPKAKAPPIEYRSAFESYRPFAEQELTDWRKANDAVREAGGHAGHKPGQGAGDKNPKPQPGSPGAPRHGSHK